MSETALKCSLSAETIAALKKSVKNNKCAKRQHQFSGILTTYCVKLNSQYNPIEYDYFCLGALHADAAMLLAQQ